MHAVNCSIEAQGLLQGIQKQHQTWRADSSAGFAAAAVTVVVTAAAGVVPAAVASTAVAVVASWQLGMVF